MNVDKKQRGPNFTQTERELLLKLANNAKHIIENKKSDGLTWKQKDEAWKKIKTRFNSMTTGPLRTANQLKCKYEGIKKELKKKYSVHKRHTMDTRGGNCVALPLTVPSTEAEKVLSETIALQVQGLHDPLDIDQNQDFNEGNEEVQEEAETSAVAKFENLAERKLQLVEAQLALVEEKRNQERFEHEMRLKNLNIENEILRLKLRRLTKSVE